jgi:DNA topoisomerase-1
MSDDLARRAKEAGLRYVDVAQLRLRRKKSGNGFVYLGRDGRVIRDRKIVDRLNALVLPPAWMDVRIAEDAKAHIQAIGRDSEGRLQYRYHDDWTAIRDALKSERLLLFGRALPKIRTRIERDLKRRTTDRRYAAAAAARLIDRALLRSGHSEAGIDEGGRGATTLLKRDVQLNGTRVFLNFTGKSGKTIRKTLHDPILLARLKKLKRIGKKRLFAFKDEKGRCCYLSARDLNQYIREAAGCAVTAKDFRTFAASAQAVAALAEAERPEAERRRKGLVASVMRDTAELLANTPAVTRSSYVHPMVVAAFEEEALDGAIVKGATRTGLDKAETALMRFLENGAAPAEAAPSPQRNGVRRRRVTRSSKREEKWRWQRRRSTRSGRSSTASTSA